MTRFDRVEPRLSQLLTDLAAPGLPDYTDDVLARTAGLRQRPRWTLLERWLPMGVLAQRSVYIPRIPWRTVIVAALLLVTIAAVLAWAGSQRRPAPPFGLAKNGLIMYSVDGDLMTWDPVSDSTSKILAGTTNDFTGMFSRDGTKLAFLRLERSEVLPELISIQVANADGSNPVDVTGPLEAPDQWDWSPAGDLIAVTSKIDHRPTLQVAPVDGSAPLQVLDTGGTVSWPAFLPPDGDEIVYRGVIPTADGERSALFAISSNGGDPRALTPIDGDPEFSYNTPMPSPDGRHVLYDFWDPVAERAQLRVLDLESGTAVDVGHTNALYGEGHGMFSPDGNQIVYRGFGDDSFQLYVAPVDGSAEPREIARVPSGDAWYEFSPDATKVMLNEYDRATTQLIDITTGEAERLPDEIKDPGTWQRLAP
jgi:Tol biopolymer transport system component